VKTTVANIRDGIPPNSVYIGRAGRGFDGYFGNPYSSGTRAENIAAFRESFIIRIANDQEYAGRIDALEGKVLLCFCEPLDCHGDVIADYLNGGDVYREAMEYMAALWGVPLNMAGSHQDWDL
jgi:hypothetical protein